jgi:hypothetical protein
MLVADEKAILARVQLIQTHEQYMLQKLDLIQGSEERIG